MHNLANAVKKTFENNELSSLTVPWWRHDQSSSDIVLLKQEFYGDLVYRLKKIVGTNNFSAQIIKISSHSKRIGYNIKVLQQTVRVVVNPIMVGNFYFAFFLTLHCVCICPTKKDAQLTNVYVYG